MRFVDLPSDPLTRLVMRSDGVTKRDMVVLGNRVRSALAARAGTGHDRCGNHRVTRSDRQRTTTVGHS
jgi:hypothetical protein